MVVSYILRSTCMNVVAFGCTKHDLGRHGEIITIIVYIGAKMIRALLLYCCCCTDDVVGGLTFSSPLYTNPHASILSGIADILVCSYV